MEGWETESAKRGSRGLLSNYQVEEGLRSSKIERVLGAYDKRVGERRRPDEGHNLGAYPTLS